MRRKTIVIAAALTAFFGLALGVRADDRTTPLTDKDFIKEAMRGGLAEVKFGELAQTRASNPQVRKLGEKIVADHTRTNKELMAILQEKGQPTATREVSKKTQDAYDRLSRLNGAEFDKAFLSFIIEDHKQDVAQFEAIAKNSKDQEVRAFATKTLPIIREHYQKARELAGGSTQQR
jgi:putative membrane protein